MKDNYKFKKMGRQHSFHLISILYAILATQAVFCSAIGTRNSVSHTLEYDSNFHEQYALGDPLPESLIRNAERFREGDRPARVAIIGGGIAGLSTAYFLHNDERLGASTQVTIFEREAQTGGRIRTAQVYNTGDEMDTGGHTFDTDDSLMDELARTLDVHTYRVRVGFDYGDWRYRSEEFTALDRASLWDGQTLSINVADEPPLTWSSLKDILIQDGLKPRFWMNIVHTLRRAFTDEDLQDWLDWDLVDRDVKVYREMLVWAAARARPGPNKADLQQFAYTNSISLKQQNVTYFGNMDILSRLGTHLSHDDLFSLKLGSTVTQIKRGQQFNVSWIYDSDSGQTETFSEKFDYVIIAAPFSQSHITISPPLSVAPQEVAYQPLHVTQFITRAELDPRTFQLPLNIKVPKMIWNVGDSTGNHTSPAPDFISITKESSSICEGCVCFSEPIYRVISKERFSDSDIATLFNKFGKARKEVKFTEQCCGKLEQDSLGTTIGENGNFKAWEEEGEVRWSGCVNHPEIRWMHRDFWPNGIPVLDKHNSSGEQDELVELAPRLYYVSGFEGREGASISKSVRNARKASDLLTEKYGYYQKA
ncbi:hypothetical protein N7456_007498 [Penicillium angulare]|uniref:Amine oxidase domain-containing protein n=1 Tax=Penicillium angulare TaxID=116970 RepID=A0A9W9FAS8_9EURO|nr:hypothetical protein N7456_007498 [Penicillium angulare]